MAKTYFYFGSMNCGKTTKLIQTVVNYQQQGMKCLIIKPTTDTRDGDACSVKSRITEAFPAVPYDPNKTNNKELANIIAKNKPDVVLVDEVQFFGERIKFLIKLCDRRNIPLLCYGLRNSFNGESFPASVHLLVHADKIEELRSICWCGCKATHNLLVHNGVPVRDDTDGILVGEIASVFEDDGYHAVCRRHFYKGLWKRNQNK